MKFTFPSLENADSESSVNDKNRILKAFTCFKNLVFLRASFSL